MTSLHRSSRSTSSAWIAVAAVVAGAIVVAGSAGPVSAAPTPTAVYDSINSPMPPNVPSLGFQATQTGAFGDLVQLAPGARRLTTFTVMMSSWGCQNGGGATCTTTPGATFNHPLTLTLYQSAPGTPTGIGAQVLSQTTTFSIPFRPSADPTCAGGTAWRASDNNCYNGFATPVTFDFAALPTIPTNLVWTMTYNTSNYGPSPIGGPCTNNCAYDSLNVGLSTLPSTLVGVDLDPASAIADSANSGVNCGGGSGLRTAAGCWSGLRPMARVSTLAASDAETTEVVKAADTSWVFFPEGTNGGQTGSYVTGPSTPPLGSGSAQLAVTATNQGMALGKLFLAGTRLDRLTRLAYSSDQPSGSVAPSLQFNVSYDASPTFQGRLVFEPTYSVGTVPAGWQRWTTLTGKWWATGGVGDDPGNCPQSTPCTWSQVLARFPNAMINPNPSLGALLFKVGSGPASFTGNVDHLTIGIDDGAGAITTTNYDFEPTVQCTATCYVNAATGNDLNGGTSTSDAKRTIQAAVTQVNTFGTVIVAAGTYIEDVSVSKSLTLQGAGVDQSVISGVIGGSASTVAAAAADVNITGFTITRQGNNPTDWNSALNTAGVSVQGIGNDVDVRNSKFTGNRTAIDVNNSNGSTIVDNLIQNNRTGLLLRNQTDNMTVTGNVIADNWTFGVLFIDASSGSNIPVQSAQNSVLRNNSISGNWYGGVVDRQSGGSLPLPGTTNLKNLSANWWGTPDPTITTTNPGEPAYAAQIPVAFGGAATNPGGASDIAGPASANVDSTPSLAVGTDAAPATVGFQGSTATLIVTAAGAQVGTTSRVQEGVDDVDSAGTVNVRAGTYAVSAPVSITKPLSLLGPNVGISPNSPTVPLTANPARVAEATLSPAANLEVLRIGASSVTVDGFRFTDPATAGSSNVPIVGAGGNYGGLANDVVVQNSLFDAITRIAVYTNGPVTSSGVTVTDNRVANPTRAAACGPTGTTALSACGRQLFNLWQADKVRFESNVVFAPAANGDRMRVLQVAFPTTPSLQTDGPADNITITGNTIRHACVFTCFSIAQRVDNVSITDNDVVVDAGNIVQLRQEWKAGRVTIDHNTFVATAGAAVIVDAPAPPGPSDLSGVVVTRNSITAGGVANQRTETVAAPCNWWGQPSGPTATQNFGPVTASNPLQSSNLDAVCPIPPPPAIPDFNPVTPARVFDTRIGTPPSLRDVPQGRVGPTDPLAVQLTNLPGGLVPATGVGAVSINVTATGSVGPGFVTVAPCGSDADESSVNFETAIDRANAVITQVSATGTVCFWSSTPTYLVVDINGWFKAPPGYNPIEPARLFDTRAGAPPALLTVPKTRLVGGSVLEVAVTNLPGLVPATGVGAVALNVTSTRSLSDGFATVWPCGPLPNSSNLNFQRERDGANLVIAPVSATGTICFAADNPTDLVVDINGWFKKPSGYTAVGPARVADTRTGSAGLRTVPAQKVVPGSVLSVQLTDLPGGFVPATGVGAVSINVTSTRQLTNGFLTVVPCGATTATSSVNFQAGLDRANAVITPVAADGTICITSSAPTDVVIDVNGWFSNAATPS